ncbi:carbon-nitrogen hydrolase family protein, partial [Achromobacter xylosoxidans]|nr:carbon-nitrogen hydrolase family protein [Achromobacter xylosoxidans]
MTTQTVAALQIGASPEGKEATQERILAFEAEITAS